MEVPKIPLCVIVMGPCGSGKSVIGSRLADHLGFAFVDADDLHPPSNVQKMAHGIPLTDEDRFPWLVAVRNQMKRTISVDKNTSGVIVACSALKKSYRDILRGKSDHQSSSSSTEQRLSKVVFAYLSVTRDVLETRLAGRKDHFMKGGMLESQLSILEEPPYDDQEVEDTVVVEVPSIEMTLEEVVTRIAQELADRRLLN